MLSASLAGRPLPPGILLVIVSVRGSLDPRALMRLEGLGKLKNPVTSCINIINNGNINWTVISCLMYHTNDEV
jgi:hypothetical protein